MMLWIRRAWAAYQRQIDLRILWPACKKHAPGGDLDVARAAFFAHTQVDPAWRVLPPQEVWHLVDRLD